MHIAYSAIKEGHLQITKHSHKRAGSQKHALRMQAYQATCQKFDKEIAAIQKYLPGWVPTYPTL